MAGNAATRQVRRPVAGARGAVRPSGRPSGRPAGQPPTRQVRRRGRRPSALSRLRLRTRIVLIAIAGGAVLIAWAALTRALAPRGNTKANRFDAIIVLGTPADSEGNPTPQQLARVTEAAREYDRGVATHLILTGGAAHNRFVEAEVMARVAEAQGIPASAISVETRAMDTIHNACYSARILEDHGWRSAEVISSAAHLPRAGLIFSRLPMEWRTHAAPSLEPESGADADESAALETLKTVRYLVYGQWAERCGP